MVRRTTHARRNVRGPTARQPTGDQGKNRPLKLANPEGRAPATQRGAVATWSPMPPPSSPLLASIAPKREYEQLKRSHGSTPRQLPREHRDWRMWDMAVALRFYRHPPRHAPCRSQPPHAPTRDINPGIPSQKLSTVFSQPDAPAATARWQRQHPRESTRARQQHRHCDGPAQGECRGTRHAHARAIAIHAAATTTTSKQCVQGDEQATLPHTRR